MATARLLRLTLSATLVVCAAALLAAGSAGEVDTPEPTSRPTSAPAVKARAAALDRIEGMIVSCPRAGQEWGRDAMVQSMVELSSMGLDWVAIHPYAGIRQDGSVPQWFDLSEPPKWLTRPIAEAKKLGMKIMIKPHLGYWGSGFSWRGEIDFDSEEKWDRFFVEYRRWILRVAELSKGADLFVVGTELDKTIRHEERWRTIIREVRERYSGPVTYSANWTDYHRVAFWDALDVVGVHAYFPVVREGEAATRENIESGWRRVAATLRDYSTAQQRGIVFTELGYNRAAHAALRPWDYKTGGADAERIQRDCLDIALRTISREECIRGAFLWKWFSEGGAPSNFSMHDPHVREVIRERWGPPKRNPGAGR